MAINSIYSSGYSKITNNFNSKAVTSGTSCPTCGQAKSASCPTCGGNGSAVKSSTSTLQSKQTTANCPGCKTGNNSSASYSSAKPNTSSSTAKTNTNCPTCKSSSVSSYSANSSGARLQSTNQKSNWLW